MTPTFKYNREKQCLEEQPRMACPLTRNYDSEQEYSYHLQVYEEHIASLKSYDTPHTDWPTGELREGEHFEIEYEIFKMSEKPEWVKVDLDSYKSLDGSPVFSDMRRIIAVPLSPSKEEKAPLFADLIYEQDLPEMSDEEYTEWYKKSHIVDGVRMGPLVSQENDEDLVQLFDNNFDCYADADNVVMAMTREQFMEVLSKYKITKRI